MCSRVNIFRPCRLPEPMEPTHEVIKPRHRCPIHEDERIRDKYDLPKTVLHMHSLPPPAVAPVYGGPHDDWMPPSPRKPWHTSKSERSKTRDKYRHARTDSKRTLLTD